MAHKSAGTVITESRGDGTLWEYVINDDGVHIGHMIGTESEYYKQRGYQYSAQTGRWEKPST